MRIKRGQVGHDLLSGVSADDHHAQAHRATHETGGADRIGQGQISLDNNIALAAADTGDVYRILGKLTSGNSFSYGSVAIPATVKHNGTFKENDGTAFAIVSDRHLKHVVKTADEVVNNSATLQNDDHLSFSVLANENWYGVLYLRLTSGTTPDFKYNFAVPTGGAIGGQSPNNLGLNTLAEMDLTTARGVLTDGGVDVYEVHFVYRGGANAGTVQLQWAQNTADASDTKVLEGSALIAFKV